MTDNTIITWENIVDRTKNIIENFRKSHTETTTDDTVTTFTGVSQGDAPPS